MRRVGQFQTIIMASYSFLTGKMSRVVLLGGRHGLRLLGRSLRLLGQLVGLEREREMRLVYSWL